MDDTHFPAGHIENGEHAYPAFIREMKEELGIDIKKTFILFMLSIGLVIDSILIFDSK